MTDDLKAYLGNLSTCLVYIANEFNTDVTPKSEDDVPWNPGMWAAFYFNELEKIIGEEEMNILINS